MRRRVPLLAALVVLLGLIAPAVPALPVIGGAPVPGPAGEALGVCDPLDPAHCLLPFPNDLFTVADPTTDSGRRVDLSPLAMPTNVAGKPWDTTEWNRNDGFSPGTPILARVPGLDLQQTWGIAGDQISDLSLSLAPDAPIVLLDADTGTRHPFWSELDTHPDTGDDERLLIVRPATNLTEGHRYVVALRRLRDGAGAVIPAQEPFRVLRDGTPAPVLDPALEQRRVAVGRTLADLEGAGVGRDDLYLAWDFTVASRRNLTERALTMRDDAFARLGDTDLADGRIQGVAPHVEITEVTDLGPDQHRVTARTVRGTITVPSYLTPQVATELAAPELTSETLPVALPGSRIHYGPDDLPQQNPLQPTVDVPFDCHLPRPEHVPHADGRADPLLYGHGLLGGRGEAGGSSTEDLRLRGFAPCAVDWWGMSFADISTVGLILADMSMFPSLPDRAQQGFVNFLYLGRALAHPDGLAAHPAFQDGHGTPLIRTGDVEYAGNSQGGIMGGPVAALSPDVRRAVLGVTGMNYSTLLNRSVDWEGAYAEIAYATYPDKIDQQLLFALIQMLWDRGESNGYANHMTRRPLPDTPSHAVMLQVAYSDHQVANVAAEVKARSVGARLRTPALGPDSPHWSVDPSFGMAPASYGRKSRGESVLVYWYSADRGNEMPPNGNVPPRSGTDPHGDPRKDNAASDQVAHWLRTGELIDVCGRRAPCVTTEATRANW
jgi:hypothetical protein